MGAANEAWKKHRRHLALALLAGALVVAWLAGGAPADALLQRSAALLDAHAPLGQLAFAALAAASAMLAFFSSAVLVPTATVAWGTTATFLLLWAGWIAGGVVAYAIGRKLGRAAAHRLVDAGKLRSLEERVSSDVRWWMLLLLQLALPSELPGYLAGTLRVRFRDYLLAVTLGELPWALAAVVLGEALVARDILVIALVLIGGGGMFAVVARALRLQLRRR